MADREETRQGTGREPERQNPNNPNNPQRQPGEREQMPGRSEPKPGQQQPSDPNRRNPGSDDE